MHSGHNADSEAKIFLPNKNLGRASGGPLGFLGHSADSEACQIEIWAEPPADP